MQLMSSSGTIANVEERCGKIHVYLVTKLDYTLKGEVIIDMVGFIESFPEKGSHWTEVKMLWNDHLFKTGFQSNQNQEQGSSIQLLHIMQVWKTRYQSWNAYLEMRVKSMAKSDDIFFILSCVISTQQGLYCSVRTQQGLYCGIRTQQGLKCSFSLTNA